MLYYKSTRFLRLVALPLALVACGDRGITDANEERTLQVVGRVTACADDSPLAASSITVYDWRFMGSPSVTLARTTTNENGHYDVSVGDRGLCDSSPLGDRRKRFEVSATHFGYDRATSLFHELGVRCIEGAQRVDLCLQRLQQTQ